MKNNLRGFKDVFTFTLVQTLKNKAFIVSYIILIVLALVSMPLITKITGGGKSNAEASSPVKKVYVINETSISNIDFNDLTKDKRFSAVTFEAAKEDYAALSKRIEEKEKESIIFTIKESSGEYSLDLIKASSGPVSENSLQILGDAISRQFEASKMKALDIKAEQLSLIKAQVNTKVTMADAGGVEINKKNTSISSSQYWFIYGILFVVMMVNIMASTQIATSIVTEKSTRVVEYLLISVKPLAIMVGKITAMLLAVLFQIISMLAVLVLSNKLSSTLSTGNNESLLSKYLPENIFQNLNFINIMFCLVLIVLGMIFYATLAGLTGATVSRIEEISEGLTLFTFINLIGVYIGIAAAGILMGKGINGFVIFSFLFPLSSPFILSGAILIGKATLLIALGAIILQLLFIVLLSKFVAKVYETLILHSGSKIKIKDLIKISKTV